jgi:hypothetical protein
LKCIHFGIGNTLIRFGDKYFEYDGDRNVNDKGLTIGGYKSALLADLVAALFSKTQPSSLKRQYAMEYAEMAGGLVVFKGN